MTALHVLVVDDEPLARRAVVQALRGHTEVARLSEAEDARSAAAALATGDVDLAYLDIRLPGADGLELVRDLGPQHLPPVIFVTAFERHAVEAFGVRALDYLLKPFSQERFDESFARALAAIRNGSERPAATTPNGRLEIRTGGRTTFVAHEEIVWIEAASSYVRVHTDTETLLLRESLNTLEADLEPHGFARVHRSAIVRIHAIRGMRHVLRGDQELLLSNGDRVRASRRRRAQLLARLPGRPGPRDA